MKEQAMFLLPTKNGNAARRYGYRIIDCVASIPENKNGKYIQAAGTRFEKNSRLDQNGNPYHREVSEYSAEYNLYETKDHAEQMIERKELLVKLHYVNYDELDLQTLKKLAEIIRTAGG